MKLKNTLTYFIALVWFLNGMYCKVLNQIPRHEQIVGEILGFTHSRVLTVLIGFSEIIMSIWILTNYKSKINAITQVVIILTMNVLEFLLVPELLLWGKFNILFAFLFLFIIFYNECYLKKNQNV